MPPYNNTSYHSTFYWGPTDTCYPRLRRVPCSEEDNIDDLSPSPPPIHAGTTAAVELDGVSAQKSRNGVDNMRPRSLPPIETLWRGPEDRDPVRSCSQSRSCSYRGAKDANCFYPHSRASCQPPPIQWPQLKLARRYPERVESGNHQRPGSRSSLNTDEDRMSVDELEDDDDGLPDNLIRLKLSRPQEVYDSDESRSSSWKSDFALPISITPDRRTQITRHSPHPEIPISRAAPLELRRISREHRRPPSPPQRKATPSSEPIPDKIKSGLITRIIIPPEDKNNWASYAEDTRDDERRWRCKWSKDGSECGYTAKKQLIKRHLETTHLDLKLFRCDICGRDFGQESGAITHVTTHTGETPFSCRFRCGKSFNDPARRHRHYVDVHNHVPKRTNRTRRRNKGLVPDASGYVPDSSDIRPEADRIAEPPSRVRPLTATSTVSAYASGIGTP